MNVSWFYLEKVQAPTKNSEREAQGQGSWASCQYILIQNFLYKEEIVDSDVLLGNSSRKTLHKFPHLV